MYLLNGRIVHVTRVAFEINEGIEVLEAYFEDTGLDLEDHELRALETLYYGEIYEREYANAVDRAIAHA